MKSNHIVLTTISEPVVLLQLQKNLQQYGHLDSTVCWVVGDKKTPSACIDLCQRVTDTGLEVRYLDIEAQDKWGERFREFYDRLAYNNETRRNIGYLFAMEHGCERLISIDDDNYPTGDDFIGGHLKTGRQWEGRLIEDRSGYYNICEHLTVHPDRLLFPRGFPFELRGKTNSCALLPAGEGVSIGVTSGLWTNEPDVDAVTWLNGKVESIEYKGPCSLVLGQNTWSPINTQNTSVVRELIPAFFTIPMGFEFPGGRIERYGDIWGGYFLQAIMTGTAYHICFGQPVVEHRRNPHNYLDDLRYEFWGMILTDWLLSVLREEFKPTGTAIIERVEELSAFLQEVGCLRLPKWCPEDVRNFITQTARTLCLWANVCRQITARFQRIAL